VEDGRLRGLQRLHALRDAQRHAHLVCQRPPWRRPARGSRLLSVQHRAPPAQVPPLEFSLRIHISICIRFPRPGRCGGTLHASSHNAPCLGPPAGQPAAGDSRARSAPGRAGARLPPCRRAPCSHALSVPPPRNSHSSQQCSGGCRHAPAAPRARQLRLPPARAYSPPRAGSPRQQRRACLDALGWRRTSPGRPCCARSQPPSLWAGTRIALKCLELVSPAYPNPTLRPETGAPQARAGGGAP